MTTRLRCQFCNGDLSPGAAGHNAGCSTGHAPRAEQKDRTEGTLDYSPDQTVIENGGHGRDDWHSFSYPDGSRLSRAVGSDTYYYTWSLDRLDDEHAALDVERDVVAFARGPADQEPQARSFPDMLEREEP